ncbi:MAG: preprotein translocase subunit SecE [Armatimonadota bacterium]
MANAGAKKPGIFNRPGKFLRETWLELRKTSWPSQDDLRKNTLLVLAAVIIITIWIGGLDALLGIITKKLGL